jgi:predicted PurR-regulated permease PerM
MSHSPLRAETRPLRRLLLALLLVTLALGCLLVLSPLLAPIAWAAILAYASWPLYRRLLAQLRKFSGCAALLMTVLMTCAVVLPVLWLLLLMKGELASAYGSITEYLTRSPKPIPDAVRGIPLLSSFLQEGLDRYTDDPTALSREIVTWFKGWSAQLTGILGGFGRNIAKLIFTMLTLFFLYRDGDTLVQQGSRVVNRFFGDRLTPYIHSAGMMTRAVLYGLLITAIAQGTTAGIGYRIVGLKSPALLGVLTGALSVIPAVGTGIVWLPASVWLLITGPVWKGVLLLIWGSALVHPIDNVLRPLMISNATHVPFILIMFGAVGGVTAFGLVGLFIGPALLGTAMAIWREWATPEQPEAITPRVSPCRISRHHSLLD